MKPGFLFSLHFDKQAGQFRPILQLGMRSFGNNASHAPNATIRLRKR
jgi:hypothetical protein